MSKFTLKTVRDGHTMITGCDAVEIFENGENHGYPCPFVDIYENNRVRERLHLDFVGTLYVENLAGKTVKTLHGSCPPSVTTSDGSTTK